MIFSCKALGAENPDCPDSGSGRFKAQEYHLPSGTGLDQLVIDGNDGRLKKEGNDRFIGGNDRNASNPLTAG